MTVSTTIQRDNGLILQINQSNKSTPVMELLARLSEARRAGEWSTAASVRKNLELEGVCIRDELMGMIIMDKIGE